MHFSLPKGVKLPPGLELHQSTGVISGAARESRERATYEVNARNTGGVDKFELSLTVHDNSLLQMLATADNERKSKEEAAASAGGEAN